MSINAKDIQDDIQALIDAARVISADLASEVAEALRAGREKPLTDDEAVALLTKVVTSLRDRAVARGDMTAMESLAGDVNEIVARIVRARKEREAGTGNGDRRSSETWRSLGGPLVPQGHAGIGPGPVRPTPIFHGREVPMNCGFVKTVDLVLWENNERLDIHLAQFKEHFGRGPTPAELLDLMLSRLHLEGIPDDTRHDQFEIPALARSIATNGVQRPPILSRDGALLDGNRRVAACHYLIHSDEFSADQKRRVENLFVWQLSPHSTAEHEDAVVVALNFESDHKQEWPEYVKARKINDEYQTMVAAFGGRTPSPREQAAIKLELSKKFALGPDAHVVNRYLKMVRWATDFEEYQINARRRNEFEVQHKASRYFQYFDELAKGEKNGVARTLEDDDNYRHLVFDLLFQGKFSNWKQIRELKKIYDNDEALTELRKAHEAPDADAADEHIENAVSIARTKRAEARAMGANTRIESFVQWLKDLPISAFRDQIRAENLRKLLEALRLVEGHARSILDQKLA
jgi:hypothetical protein